MISLVSLKSKKILLLKNALAYCVVVVHLKVVGLALGHTVAIPENANVWPKKCSSVVVEKTKNKKTRECGNR
jgi:hypothetical protein